MAVSVSGIVTHKATTTVKIDLFDGSINDLHKLIQKSLKEAGWMKEPYRCWVDEDGAMKLSEAALKCAVGTIVEYRDGQFIERKEGK